MTQPETAESLPVSDRASAETAGGDAAAAEAEAPVAPEPWTPERVVEWNAYYDLYVMLGVLLLVFLASANRITHSSIWNQLQVGRMIAATGRPVTTDQFSYTVAGQPWVNIPWLFDLAHAEAYRLGKDFAPVNADDPVASAVRADQIGAGVMVALDALVRLFTAFFLMRIRRAGPGLWWTAVCTILALSAVITPAGLVLGGIAMPGIVTPGTWGLLFLAVEMWLIHRSLNLGRLSATYWLVPLFALWANVDDTFLVGLLALAATIIGQVRPTRDEDPQAFHLPGALLLLVLCAAACLVNPSHVKVYGAAAAPVTSLFRPSTDVATFDQLSYFGPSIRRQPGDAWIHLLTYYLIAVGIGYASFALNYRRFSLSRFLTYTLMVVLWGTFIRFAPEFSVVLAMTLGLNGQEWYQAQFGARGQVGLGWMFWSVGGRALTIVAIFACIAKGLTGFGASAGEPQFGFGYEPSEMAFEAADFLATAPISGNVLNTTLSQGDSLIWRASAERKTFNDSRQHLFPPDLVNRREEARKALSEDDTDGWKQFFDDFKISVVMIDPSNSPKTYRVLSQSTNWIPFHDDGNVVLFGRADAAPGDVGFFKANRLDADALAYKRPKAVPAPERPPSPVSWMDTIFRTRALSKPQPHTQAAARWLSPPSSDPQATSLPDPAHCLLAIREARTALAVKPDDTTAYRLLAAAYRALMVQETALLQGLSLTPENAAVVSQVTPRPELLKLRYRQRVAALNYAIQTTPPPTSDEARKDLQALNMELSQIYMTVNMFDLARDRVQAILDNSGPLDPSADLRTQISQHLAQLNEQVTQIQNQMQELAAERQYGPIQLASYAMSQGAPGLAIHELAEAERTGTNPAVVKPQLFDLYCDTGQPDKAVEMLGGQAEDPTFGAEPGASPMRQGRSFFLLGNAEYASTLWDDRAIPRLREDRISRALGSIAGFARGEPKFVVASLLEMPDRVALQASWEYDAAICRLEGGNPELAAEHFTKALILVPKYVLRPVIAYYLGKLGKPVPALPAGSKEAAPATSAPTATSPAPTRPATPEPAPETPKPAPPPKPAAEPARPATPRAETPKAKDTSK